MLPSLAHRGVEVETRRESRGGWANMGGFPRLRETRTIHAGGASGAVVRGDISDLMLVELSVTVVFFFERELDVARLADSLSGALGRLPAFAGRLRRRGGGL